MEREVGGGIGMGNTCKPMAVSFQCMIKSTTNKKKKERKWSWFPFLFILPIPDNFYSILPNLCYFFLILMLIFTVISSISL